MKHPLFYILVADAFLSACIILNLLHDVFLLSGGEGPFGGRNKKDTNSVNISEDRSYHRYRWARELTNQIIPSSFLPVDRIVGRPD